MINGKQVLKRHLVCKTNGMDNDSGLGVVAFLCEDQMRQNLANCAMIIRICLTLHPACSSKVAKKREENLGENEHKLAPA